jgi:hypothetical protein
MRRFSARSTLVRASLRRKEENYSACYGTTKAVP